jgi:hypothetical protein
MERIKIPMQMMMIRTILSQLRINKIKMTVKSVNKLKKETSKKEMMKTDKEWVTEKLHVIEIEKTTLDAEKEWKQILMEQVTLSRNHLALSSES